MEEAHVCPLGADEDDGVTYARTHARGRFFRGGGGFFCLFGKVVVTCMYAWRRGRRRRERDDDDDNDDVFHVFEPGGRAHVAEKQTGEVQVVVV